MIKKEIVQDLGQPRFQIGSGVELLVRRESANKRFLDQILGVGWISRQMKCHPVQMVEVSHGLVCDSIAPAACGFSLPDHGRILTNCAVSV